MYVLTYFWDYMYTSLTHWSLHKMTNIIWTTFLWRKYMCLPQLSLQFVLKGPVDNDPALILWFRWTGNKPLSETMVNQNTDIFVSLGLVELVGNISLPVAQTRNSVCANNDHYWKPTFDFTLILWRRHQMETFSALLAICAENSPVPGEFPAQWPVTRSFDVFPWSESE